MKPRPWLQVASCIASIVVVLFALTFRHAVIAGCGLLTLVYSLQESD